MHEFLVDRMSVLTIPPGLAVFLSAMLPVVEGRYAMVVGWRLQAPFTEAFVLAVLGNLAAVVPLFLALGPLSRWGRRSPLIARALDWVFGHARKRKSWVDRYGVIGLTLLMGAPIPFVGGAWTGLVVAFVVGMGFRPTAVAMLLGVVMSVLIVGIPTYFGGAAWDAVTN